MHAKSSRSAFTALEMIISVTLLGLVVGGIVSSTNKGLDLFRQSSSSSDLSARNGRALSRVVREVLAARLGTVTPDLNPPPAGPHTGSPAMEFQRADGYAAGLVIWGTRTNIGFELDEGETDDGVDEDGDGLIDEGQIVMIQDVGGPDQRRVVLAHGVSEFLEGETANGLDDNGNGLVDERGLSFDLSDGVLHVRLTLERLGPRGQVDVKTEERAILLRNQ